MQNYQLVSNLTKNISYTLAIIVIALLARVIAQIFISTLSNQLKRKSSNSENSGKNAQKRTDTLTGVARNIINVLIFGSMVLMLMSQWGINVAPILTGAGILGLAVGFGTQTLVKDLVTGFFILLENHYNVGDTIKIAGVEGEIIDINIRTTILKGLDNETHIIPNSQIGTITRLKKL